MQDLSLDGSTDVSDTALAARIAAGDRGAFEQLMRRYNRRLFRVARATLGEDRDAEDALQDAYLAAYRSIASFRGGSTLSTWLTRIVLNECYARLRRTARRDNVVPITLSADGELPLDVPDTNAESPEQAAMREEIRQLLVRHVDALPSDLRTVFVMRSVEDLSVEETAQCLGIPEATVRTRHFRARALLRDSLTRDVDVAERELFEFDGARCDRIVANVLAAIERATT
jgi:RNA polymerase sigma-70 factor (ECF subfamily)